MFTGIIEQLGRIRDIRREPFATRLVVDCGDWTYVPAPGDSIAVDGCCLTLAATESGFWAFDVIRQTLEVTTLGDLEVGATVNLERAATPTTLLGGHLVQGHIDGVGIVLGVTSDPTQWRVRISAPAAMRPLLIDRGSITVNGVSLTLAALGGEWFEVALIPTTLAKTTLGSLKVGERVNLESDCLVRAVASVVAHTLAAGATPPSARTRE